VEVTEMADEDEVAQALCRVLTEIAEREKRKALQRDDYGSALVASIFEGIFKEAEHSYHI
jgi:phage baseplate assembly protein W